MTLPFHLLSEAIVPWSRRIVELAELTPSLIARLDAARAEAREAIKVANVNPSKALYQEAMRLGSHADSIEGEFDAAFRESELLKAAVVACRNFSVGMDRRTAIRLALRNSMGYADAKREDGYARSLNRFAAEPGEPVNRAELFRNELNALVPKVRPLDDSRVGMALKAVQ